MLDSGDVDEEGLRTANRNWSSLPGITAESEGGSKSVTCVNISQLQHVFISCFVTEKSFLLADILGQYLPTDQSEIGQIEVNYLFRFLLSAFYPSIYFATTVFVNIRTVSKVDFLALPYY